MYEIGRVYIWQNMPRSWAVLNGQETTVMKKPEATFTSSGGLVTAQMTDTPVPFPGYSAKYMAAKPGQLRPKEYPPGERKVRELFNPTKELA